MLSFNWFIFYTETIIANDSLMSCMLRQMMYVPFQKCFYPLVHRPLVINTLDYKSNEGILRKAMNLVMSNKLEGDYLEFGIYKGQSFVAAYNFANYYPNLNAMNFYAFDSFHGQPPLDGVDAEGFQHFKTGQYYCSLAEFKQILEQNKVDTDRVKIIPGWFKDTLNEKTKNSLQLKKAAVVMIDCDLYESTVSVLEFITSYLQDGTILIFDGWFCYRGNPNRGEQRAFREWLQRHPEITAVQYQTSSLYGNSFIVTVNPPNN